MKTTLKIYAENEEKLRVFYQNGVAVKAVYWTGNLRDAEQVIDMTKASEARKLNHLYEKSRMTKLDEFELPVL